MIPGIVHPSQFLPICLIIGEHVPLQEIFPQILVNVNKLGINPKLLCPPIEIEIALGRFTVMLLIFRIFVLVNFHQHERKKNSISQFLSHNCIEMIFFMGAIVRRINENLLHFRGVDIVCCMHKPNQMNSWFFIEYDFGNLLLARWK